MSICSTQKDQARLADELLAQIEALVTEMHAGKSRSFVLSLDCSLDRDIGLDSLARVELIARIEQHFNLTLPQQVFTEAESPRDLLRSIATARGQKQSFSSKQVIERAVGKIDDLPDTASTLVDLLEWHLRRHPDRLHIHLLDDENETQSLTYEQLWQGAHKVAAGLQQRGIQSGETVAIMLPTGRDYFFSFLGILLTGAIPVPIYPPVRRSQLEDHLQRHNNILNNCAASILITMPEARIVARLLKSQVLSLRDVVTVSELASLSAEYIRPSITPEDIAFLQYTSGSTGNPKGVVLTHANLLANIRAMGKTVEVTADDVFISWLPLYHDMGLIGAWLGSLYFAMLFVVMSPLSFLSSPKRWLWAIHRYRGTLSASPNFGYELCLSRLEDEALEGLDLSSWRLAFNGAEPVSPDSIERFSRRFEPYGFRPEAMLPVYGLAETSVGLAFPPLHRRPVIDRIKREDFSQSGLAVAAEQTDKNALRIVACGRALPGHEIRIVDVDGKELPERQQGALQFRGPSTTSGYYRNPETTRALFDGDWLVSGDLAYIADGDIFITGRNKDMIIRAGRNVYPPEVEEAVGNIENIRNGCVVAFAAKDRQFSTERLVILAETRETDAAIKENLTRRISDLCADLIGLPPDEVVLAPPHTVLKTSSGKVRRSACRELYEQNRLGQAPRSFWSQITRTAIRSMRPVASRLVRNSVNALYAVYVWTLFLVIAAVAWIAVLLLPGRKLRWRVVRTLARLLVFTTATKMVVNGLENLSPENRVCVFVANHASYLDSFAVVAAIPRDLSFVAKQELRNSIFTSSVLKRLGTEFVERFDKRQGVKDAGDIAREKQRSQSLFFFPEGTFTRVSGLQHFHMGAFITAAEADLPVVPVAIRGSRSMLPPDTWMPRRGRIDFTIGKAITPEAVRDGNEIDAWKTALKLKQAAHSHILAHCGEADLSRS